MVRESSGQAHGLAGHRLRTGWGRAGCGAANATRRRGSRMSHVHAGWRAAVLLIAMAPLAYYITAILAALRFFRRERARTLPSYAPPVSLLKPVRGVDFGSYQNFASFCRQDYPEYEILFAVNDEDDPAVPLIRRLAAEFPQRRIRLVVGA